MKEKLRQFMAGRYGADQLGRFLMGSAIVVYILYMLLRIRVFELLFFALILSYYYRALSRNHARRYDENLRFLRLRGRFQGRLTHSREEMSQRKIYRFYTCPTCRQRVRVPRGRGKISITCPRCRGEFIRRS